MESLEIQISQLITQAEENEKSKNQERAIELYHNALQLSFQINEDLKDECHSELYFRYGNALLILCENNADNQILADEVPGTIEDKAVEDNKQNGISQQEFQENQEQEEQKNGIKEQDNDNQQNQENKENQIDKTSQQINSIDSPSKEEQANLQNEQNTQQEPNKNDPESQCEKQTTEGDIQLAWENLETARICVANGQLQHKINLSFKIHKRLGDLQSMREHYDDAINEYKMAIEKLQEMDSMISRNAAEMFFVMGNCSQLNQLPKQACFYFAQAIQVLDSLKNQSEVKEQEIQEFDQFINEIQVYILDARTQEQDLQMAKQEIKQFFEKSAQPKSNVQTNCQLQVKDLGIIKSKRKREEEQENQTNLLNLQQSQKENQHFDGYIDSQGSEAIKKQKLDLENGEQTVQEPQKVQKEEHSNRNANEELKDQSQNQNQ